MPSVLDELLTRRVLFVTGKGGAGKSTVAAATALIATSRGLRVLLVDVEGRSDAAGFLGAGPSGYRPREAIPGLSHLAINPEDAFEEYLRVGLKLPRLHRLGPVGRVFDFIATAAPGVEEVLIAGKIGFEERATEGSRPRWDLIVVDAAPTGQVLSHIRGPRTLMELVKVGLVRSQGQWVREVLEDPRRTGIVVVSLCEEMPVAETQELLERAPEQVRTPVLALVANRMVSSRVSRAALREVRAAEPKLSEALGAALAPAVQAASLVADLARNQAPHLRRLQQLGVPMLRIRQLAVHRHDLSATRAIADELESSQTAASREPGQ